MAGLKKYIGGKHKLTSAQPTLRDRESAQQYKMPTDGTFSTQCNNNDAHARGTVASQNAHSMTNMGQNDGGMPAAKQENYEFGTAVDERLGQDGDLIKNQPDQAFSNEVTEGRDDDESEHLELLSDDFMSDLNDELFRADRKHSTRMSSQDAQYLHQIVSGLNRVDDESSYPPTTSGRITDITDEDSSQHEVSTVAEEVHELEEVQQQVMPTGRAPASQTGIHHERMQYREKHIMESNQTYWENVTQHHVVPTNNAKHKVQHIPETFTGRPGQRTSIGHPSAQRVVPAAFVKVEFNPFDPPSRDIHHNLTESPRVRIGNNDKRTTVPHVQQFIRFGPSASHVPTSANVEVDNGFEPASLDYALDTLHTMKFEDLRQESFDNNHQKGIFFAPIVEGSNLLGRLALVAKGSREEQTQFLASLAATEWEEAGTWFTEQFSVLTQKMQHSRNERRKVAETFEEEINRRHNDVSKEIDSLQMSLKEMRRSGDAVLKQATPKRGRGLPLSK